MYTRTIKLPRDKEPIHTSIDIIKYNRTIGHIHDINMLTIDRVLALLRYGYTLKPKA